MGAVVVPGVVVVPGASAPGSGSGFGGLRIASGGRSGRGSSQRGALSLQLSPWRRAYPSQRSAQLPKP